MEQMVKNKTKQMEDDHKMFQQKLDELKTSMADAQHVPKSNPVINKGDEILAELDRMRERLRKGRQEKPVIHPSTHTQKDIVIENPISELKIDTTNYAPDYKNRSFNELDRSLPAQTTLKAGLNNSQNFKSFKEESINDRDLENIPEVREEKDDAVNMKSPTIPKRKRQKLSRHISKTKEMEKPVERKQDLNNTLKSQNIKLKVPQFDQDEEEEEREESRSVDESMHMPDSAPVGKHTKLHSRIPEDSKEQVLKGERPGSPIIPALRKKILQSQTIKESNDHKVEKSKSPPKRAVTEIGQGPDPEHMRYKSVTNLGVDQDQSLPVPMIEDSRDLGKPPLAHAPSYTPKARKLVDGIEAKFQANKHKKFTDFVSMKDSNENLSVGKSGPVTARKEYLSDGDVGDKKNSFRKFILGVPHGEPPTPAKESSSEQDASVIQDLPASMKKLRQLSADRTPRSFHENPVQDYFKSKEEEESSDVEFGLKFMNKKTLKSNKSIGGFSQPQKISTTKKPKKKNPYSKFQNRKRIVSPVSSKRGHNDRNVSFEETPQLPSQPKNIAQRQPKVIKDHEPEQYLVDEVISENLRESLSRNMPEYKSDMSLRQLAPDEKYKSSRGSSLRKQQEDLEYQREYLKRKEQANQSQYLGEDASNYQPYESSRPYDYKITRNNRSRPHSRSNIDSHRHKSESELPDIHRDLKDDQNDSIRKDIEELKRQLSALNKKQKPYILQEQPIIEPRSTMPELIKNQSFGEPIELAQRHVVIRTPSKQTRRQKSDGSNLSNNIANSVSQSSKRSGKRIIKRLKSKTSSVMPDAPISRMDNTPSFKELSIYDLEPSITHDKLKQNMNLYLDAEPAPDENNLARRFENQVRIIDPPLIRSVDAFSKNEHMPIPIETKRSIVSEASEFIKYYQNAPSDIPIHRQKLDDFLDDFILYIKGLKNKFLEDVIFRKLSMVVSEEKKQELMNNYPSQHSIEISQDSSRNSNQVVLQDSNFENLQGFEKEIDQVISDEERSITILKEDTNVVNETNDIGGIEDDESVSVSSEFQESERMKARPKIEERPSKFKMERQKTKMIQEPQPKSPPIVSPSVKEINPTHQQDKNRPPPIVTQVSEKEEPRENSKKSLIASKSAESFAPESRTPTIPPESPPPKAQAQTAVAPIKPLNLEDVKQPLAKAPNHKPQSNLSNYKMPKKEYTKESSLGTGRSSKKPPKPPQMNNQPISVPLPKVDKPVTIKQAEKRKKYTKMALEE